MYPRYSVLQIWGDLGVIAVIVGILAIIGGFVLYFVFLSPENEGKYHGAAEWLYQFLNFRKLIIETILKIIYLIATCEVIIGGIFLMFKSFLAGLLCIIVGTIGLRIIYEMLLLLIILVKNVMDINNKLGPKQYGGKKGADIFEAVPATENKAPQAPAQPKEDVCSNCGAPIEKDAEFCTKCGTKKEDN